MLLLYYIIVPTINNVMTGYNYYVMAELYAEERKLI